MPAGTCPGPAGAAVRGRCAATDSGPSTAQPRHCPAAAGRCGPGAAPAASRSLAAGPGEFGAERQPVKGGTRTVRWFGVPPRMIFRSDTSLAMFVSWITFSGFAMTSM